MVSHSNPENSISFAQPPGTHISHPLEVLAAFSASIFCLHFTAFAKDSLPVDPILTVMSYQFWEKPIECGINNTQPAY